MAKDKEQEKGQQPGPSSSESEKWVIGSLLIKPGLLEDVMLDPEDFFEEHYRLLYETILELAQLEKEITPDSVKGLAFPAVQDWVVERILSEVDTSIHWKYHSERVKHYSLHRILKEIAMMVDVSIANNKEPNLIRDDALSKLGSLIYRGKKTRYVIFPNRRTLKTDPPIYLTDVKTLDGEMWQDLRVTPEQLLSKKSMTLLILSKCGFHPIFSKDYSGFVDDFVSNSRIIDAPEDASSDEGICYWIRDWMKSSTEAKVVEDLERGYKLDEGFYWIQPDQLIKRLNDMAKIRLTKTVLWAILQPRGSKRRKSFRFGDKTQWLWGIPEVFFADDQVDDEDMDWLKG